MADEFDIVGPIRQPNSGVKGDNRVGTTNPNHSTGDDSTILNVIANENVARYRSERESILDTTWLKNTFMLGGVKSDKYNKWLQANRFFSSADVKVNDTHIGNSIAINPPYQFTRYADIRRPGLIQQRDVVNSKDESMRTTGVPGYKVNSFTTKMGIGLGTYYSRAIDDNQQRIFLRFGEPQYMNMLLWATKSFDLHKAILYKRGTISKLYLSVVRVASYVFAFAAAPLLFAGKWILDFLISPGKFMSVRDNMYTYWMTVDTLLNKMLLKSTKMPLLHREFTNGVDTNINKEVTVSPALIKSLNDMAPGIVDPETGRISVWTMALSGQAAYNRLSLEKFNDDSNEVTTDPTNYRITDEMVHDTPFTNSLGEPSLFSRKFLEFAYSKIGGADIQDGGAGEKGRGTEGWWDKITRLADSLSLENNTQANIDSIIISQEEDLLYGTSINEYSKGSDGEPLLVDTGSEMASASVQYVERYNAKNNSTTYARYLEYMTAMVNNGAAFLILNVESTGSVGESFSNSTKTNMIETAFNTVSSKTRSFFEHASGMTEVPVIGSAIKLATATLATVIDTASAGFARPLLAIGYGTTVSLPKMWDSSTANLPSASYKCKFGGPYNDAYSRLFALYLPLSCILAGSLPRQTGQDTHTSPFMCQLFDAGRVNIPLGIINDVSILRGTGNLPFTRSRQPTAIDVDFSILDLNQIIAIDVDGSGLLTRAMHSLNPSMGDKAIDVYIDTITGLDVYSMTNFVANKRLKVIERQMNVRALMTDEAALAAFTVGKLPFLSTGANMFGTNVGVASQM